MHANNLLEFLGKLSKEEMEAFYAYLKKFHSLGSITIRLFKYLNKCHPNFEGDKLKAERIHTLVFKKEDFIRRVVLNEFSKLRIELKRFLVWNYCERNSFDKDLILLKEYKRLNLGKHYDKLLLSLKKEVEKEGVKDDQYFLNKMKLGHEFYYDPKKEQIKIESKNLEEVMSNLDMFYGLMKMKYTCEFHNRHEVLKESLPDLFLLDEIIERKWDDESLVHYAFQLALKLIKNRDDNVYHELKDLVTQNIDEFSAENQYILLSYLINHNAQWYKGASKLKGEDLFELYNYCIDGMFFVKDGIFNAELFINIVDLACKIEKYDWLEKFVEKWTPYLSEQVREYSIQLSKAYVCFGKGNYKEAIKLLRLVELKGSHNKVRYRLLYIASLFEDNLEGRNNDIIHRECKACEVAAKRIGKISIGTEKGLLNFVKIVKMLGVVQPNKIKIRNKLEEFKFIFFKNWLLQKIEKLK